MKKALSVVLAVAMLFGTMMCFSGCGSEKDKFVGTWETTIDLAASPLKLLESHGDGAEDLAIESFYPVTLKKI